MNFIRVVLLAGLRNQFVTRHISQMAYAGPEFEHIFSVYHANRDSEMIHKDVPWYDRVYKVLLLINCLNAFYQVVGGSTIRQMSDKCMIQFEGHKTETTSNAHNQNQ